MNGVREEQTGSSGNDSRDNSSASNTSDTSKPLNPLPKMAKSVSFDSDMPTKSVESMFIILTLLPVFVYCN